MILSLIVATMVTLLVVVLATGIATTNAENIGEVITVEKVGGAIIVILTTVAVYSVGTLLIGTMNTLIVVGIILGINLAIELLAILMLKLAKELNNE